MKRINIFMPKLKYGGMELSLINFLNYSNITKNYNVHLYLVYVEKRELLDKIDNKVTVHEFTRSWDLKGKIITALKAFCMLIKTPKSDISISYSNHHRLLATLTRKSSKNSILFVHSDLNRYTTLKEQKSIKSKIKFDKFNKIICVSKVVKDSIIDLYDDNIAKKCFIVPNYVDGDRIVALANEKIKEKINFNIPTFISIANHVEEYKNIMAIIAAAHSLKKLKYRFQVILIGSGKDTVTYVNAINGLKLSKEFILLGSKENPYPYLKKSKALLFTSKYEGYGMVLDEARVLNIPIISTGSGASFDICSEGYGIITDNIVGEMQNILDNKKIKTPAFDYQKHNMLITKSYDEIIR